MSRLLVCTGGGEPPYSSNQGVIDGLRSLGHEVVSIGPRYWDRCLCDIEVPDSKFPEYYSYEEILTLAPWQPDLIVQCEPHFYLSGKKPPEIISCNLVLDPHRGAVAFRRLAEEGSFNVVFCMQKYFMPLFQDIRGARTEFLAQAFNQVRFEPDRDGPIVCDIAMVGQTGIANMEYPHEDETGKFAIRPPINLPTDHTRFTFWQHFGFDYAERAEILIRLCKDFNVRIYGGVYDERYQLALQRGAMSVHRSLLNDVTIRCFETMAANRLLICDDIPYQEELFQDGIHCRTYRTYGFKPFFENFTAEYNQIYKLVKYHLDHQREMEAISREGHRLAWEKHSWRSRAQELLNVVFN